jgi:hypothetical protein|tara:strand:+ start:453 stop:689 length:237 start_codon:yes stop_codon:yes gene_type:complete
MAINYDPSGGGGGKDAHLTRWMSNSGRLLNALASSGTTANRPTSFLFNGRTYFDTTLDQPIWYITSTPGWVDATGTGA